MSDIPGSTADDVVALDYDVSAFVVSAHGRAEEHLGDAGSPPGGEFGKAAPFIAVITNRIEFGADRLAAAHRTFAERAELATRANLAFDYQTREAFAELQDGI